MSIDTTGKWWVGTEPEDMKEYLEAYSEQGYKVQAFRLSICPCGSVEFQLEADDAEGVAKRTCTKCRREHFICDSQEFWGEAEPERWQCECGSEATISDRTAPYSPPRD